MSANASTADTVAAVAETVLELRDVCCRETSPEAVKLRGVNLKVQTGDMVMIHLGRRQNPRSFSSLIQGLTFPSSGEVLFERKRWNDAQLEEHFRMRSRIGRVFDGRAWINNLNITENVTLRAKHHAFPAAKLQQQIDQWSKVLHVPALSRERPAFVEASRLQRFQWLRAMIGDPSLVILERPMRTLDPEMIQPLVNCINQIRKQSTAVIWFTSSGDESSQSFDEPVHHYQSKDGELIPVDRGGISPRRQKGDSK